MKTKEIASSCRNTRAIRVWISGFGVVLCLLTFRASATVTATILAGGETDLPADTPSGRLDAEGDFSFVGALAISSGVGNFKGSAVALSPEWVLTAGHNADLNDDGLPDAVWSGVFHLPGFGSFGVAQVFRIRSSQALAIHQ